MSYKNIILVLTLFAVPFASNIYAQNYNDAFRLGEQSLDTDAKTLSLGNSIMAKGGTFASTILNPAGLALAKINITQLSFSNNSFQNKSLFFNNENTASKSNSGFNQFSLVMPLPTKRGSAVLGFGYNQLKNFTSQLQFSAFNSSNTSMIQTLNGEDIIFKLGLSYPVFDADTNYLYDETLINGQLHQSGTIIEDGNLDTWVMSGAFEAAKNVFVGITLNILSGNYTYNREYIEDDEDFNTYTGRLDPQDPNTEDFVAFYLNDNIEQNISGWNIHFGLLYKVNDVFNIGASIKSPTWYEVEEFYELYGESTFANAGYKFELPETKNVYNIKTPMELSGGVSAKLPFASLSGSINYIDYSQMEFEDGFTAEERFQKNKEIESLFESVINYRAGAEINFPYFGLKLRGGFIYNTSPYKNDTSEFDKKFLTAGIGIPLGNSFNANVSYVHGWWKNFGDNYGVNVSRTIQDITVNKLLFSVSFKFM